MLIIDSTEVNKAVDALVDCANAAKTTSGKRIKWVLDRRQAERVVCAVLSMMSPGTSVDVVIPSGMQFIHFENEIQVAFPPNRAA